MSPPSHAPAASEEPSVAIVTPIFNRVAQLPRFLRSLADLRYSRRQLVVVDDGSSDGSGAYLAQHAPEAIVLRADGNQWWAGATNLGLRWALEHGFDYALTYNDDQIGDPLFLAELITEARRDPRAILSPYVYYLDQPERLVSGGIRIDPKTRRTYGVLNETVPDPNSAPYEVDGVPGYAMLIPRAVLETIGYFDARRFPQIYMELDFCLRARRGGHRIVVLPRAAIWNDRSDKEFDPAPRRSPWARFRWYLSRPKSHLHFGQTRGLAALLFADQRGLATRRRILGFWCRYWLKLIALSLFPKSTLRRLKSALRLNIDRWA